MAKLRIPVLDFSQEKSTINWNIDNAATDPQITALYNAIAGITLGSLNDAVFVTETTKDNGVAVPPANAFAQRENKWLISYLDNITNTVYKLEVPTADLGELVLNTDLLNVSAASAGEAFVNAFQAIVNSPVGNPVTFISGKFVGRNL